MKSLKLVGTERPRVAQPEQIFIRKISIKFWKIITCKQDNLKDCQWKQNLTAFISKMHKIYLRKNQSMKGQYCDNRPINDHEFDGSFLHYHIYTTNSLEIFKLITMSQRWWPTKLFQDNWTISVNLGYDWIKYPNWSSLDCIWIDACPWIVLTLRLWSS